MAKMIIVHKKPVFIFWLLQLFFGKADWDEGVIVTFGNKVYCKYELTDPLIAHEQVHVDQQSTGIPLYWIIKYGLSPEFRLACEVPAHRAEYRAIPGHDGNKKFYLDSIARRLSGPLYNNMISLDEAKKLILHEEKESY